MRAKYVRVEGGVGRLKGWQLHREVGGIGRSAGSMGGLVGLSPPQDQEVFLEPT